MARSPFFRQLRTGLLLLILAAVALDVMVTRALTHDWKQREWVAVYPIDGDASPATAEFLAGLEEDTFAGIEAFIEREAQRYGISTPLPIDLQLRKSVESVPPAPPAERSMLRNALWSLRLRHWAWRQTRDDPDPATRIRLFLVYYDPARNPELPHSVGLRELLVGVAHVFASRSQAPANNIVIAHELMHALGASDKYDPETNQPVYPHGFAEPASDPVYPQRFGEIMGGRIPLSPSDAEMPPSLRRSVVGELTAREIAWKD